MENEITTQPNPENPSATPLQQPDPALSDPSPLSLEGLDEPVKPTLVTLPLARAPETPNTAPSNLSNSPSPAPNPANGSSSKLLYGILIVVLLIALGVGAYTWYLNQKTAPVVTSSIQPSATAITTATTNPIASPTDSTASPTTSANNGAALDQSLQSIDTSINAADTSTANTDAAINDSAPDLTSN